MTRLERDGGLSASERRLDSSRVIQATAAGSALELSETPGLLPSGDTRSTGVWLLEATVVAEVDLDASVRSQVVLLRVVEEELLLFESRAPDAVFGRVLEMLETLEEGLRPGRRTTLELARARALVSLDWSFDVRRPLRLGFLTVVVFAKLAAAFDGTCWYPGRCDTSTISEAVLPLLNLGKMPDGLLLTGAGCGSGADFSLSPGLWIDRLQTCCTTAGCG
ncbi:hypothetical protein GP486_008630 [Trichoglossum hirsutum]|uniref:Uncharacterized protein n=1 Tax=Trichoglossum hirsutum TaxID=265104 RepID=A0A9P8I848_9PEZI|nr:hypothetical protein GP486_008630 [Trichoglossum hirsutum]